MFWKGVEGREWWGRERKEQKASRQAGGKKIQKKLLAEEVLEVLKQDTV